MIFVIEQYVGLVVLVALLAVKIFAFVNSLLYSAESYEAASKLNKPTWCILLGVGVPLQYLLGNGIFNIIFTVAAFVYLADVRPALAGLRRR